MNLKLTAVPHQSMAAAAFKDVQRPGCARERSSCVDVCLRLVGSATPPISSQLEICLTSDWQCWLLNTTQTDVSCAPGELFGFSTGSVVEKPLGGVEKRVGLKPFPFRVFFLLSVFG